MCRSNQRSTIFSLPNIYTEYLYVLQFWRENFDPCDEEEAGRIIGVDSIEEDGRKA